MAASTEKKILVVRIGCKRLFESVLRAQRIADQSVQPAEHHVHEKERDRDRRGDLEHDEQRLTEKAQDVGGNDGGSVGERQRDEPERARHAADQGVVRVKREVQQGGQRDLKLTDDRDALRGQRVDDVHDREPDLDVDDLAGELVARNMREPCTRKLPGEDLLIRPADRGCFHAKQHLARPRDWCRNLAQLESSRFGQHDRFHAGITLTR